VGTHRDAQLASRVQPVHLVQHTSYSHLTLVSRVCQQRTQVRAQLLGEADEPPRDAGRVAWRAVVPCTPELDAICPRGESLMAASPQEGKTMTLMCVRFDALP
jgi:hypothetical protein